MVGAEAVALSARVPLERGTGMVVVMDMTETEDWEAGWVLLAPWLLTPVPEIKLLERD